MLAINEKRNHMSSPKSAQKFYGQNFIMPTSLVTETLAQDWDNFIGAGG